jgi:hypothetical protein
MHPPNKAFALTGLMALGALFALGYALQSGQQPLGDYRCAILLGLALITARLKVKLPGLTGNMAVNLPCLLIAVEELSMLQALLIALPACAVQCFPKGGGKLNWIQLTFNLSTTAVAVSLASLVGAQIPLLGAAAFFLAQTVPVASIIRLTEGGAFPQIWSSIAHYSFPFYLLSAGMSSVALSYAPQFGWQIPLLTLPALYAIYRSYQSYFRVVVIASE